MAADSVDNMVTRLESAITIFDEGIQLLEETVYVGEVQLLSSMKREATRYIRELSCGHNDCTIPPVGIAPCMVEHGSGLVGRPRIVVNLEQVDFLRSCGYTWEEVARCLQVSRSTLWRCMREMNNSMGKYSEISDTDLDDLVASIQQQHPNCGQVMLQGFLQHRGIEVQRYRLRDSIGRNDPLRRSLRWHQAVSRRTYSVKGSNSLWHIDGHHSLIRWRLVVHGGIDGYSRTVVYLTCNPNNRASTVYQDFRHATEEYGVPSRVRSDKGGENVLVCYFMLAYRGPDRASHIAGSSVHNQRIERLWRDVYRCVCSTYHELFYEMEALGILDPDNDLDLFVLHCVYLPRIRNSLQDFANAWNLHPLRTERNWSPRKIWINSLLRDRDSIDVNPTTYGVDPTGPLPEEDFITVEVPETVCPLDSDQLAEFLGLIDIQSVFEDGGIAYYIHSKRQALRMLDATDESD